MLSHAQLFGTPWTVTHQTLLPIEFPRQEYWSGLPPSRGNCHVIGSWDFVPVSHMASGLRPAGTWKRLGEINIKKIVIMISRLGICPLLKYTLCPPFNMEMRRKASACWPWIAQCSVCPGEQLCHHTPAQSPGEPGQREYSPLSVLLTQVILLHALGLSF